MEKYNESELDAIEFHLRNNKSVIVDTDTVYGIVSLSSNLIYSTKNRPHSKKLIVFIKDFINAGIFEPNEIKVLKKYWPGKLTVIKNKVGYRVPNTKFLLDLLDRVIFLYSSSANLSGRKPIKSFEEAQTEFKKAQDKVIFVKSNTRHIDTDIPSTIINLDKNKVVRKGQIDGEQILIEISKLKN